MKYARIICLIIAIVGIIFIVASLGGTISGYRGADGQYYSDIGARGSNDWMFAPGMIVAAIGFIGFALTKNVDTPTKKSNNTLQNVEDKATKGLIALSILIPFAGIIIACNNWNDTPKAARTYIKAALISLTIPAVLAILCAIIMSL